MHRKEKKTEENSEMQRTTRVKNIILWMLNINTDSKFYFNTIKLQLSFWKYSLVVNPNLKVITQVNAACRLQNIMVIRKLNC